MSKDISRPIWLFVIPWSLDYAGGVNQVVINLYRKMKEEGVYEPRILILDWNSVRPTRAVSGGIDVVCWRMRSPYSGNDKNHLLSFFRFIIWSISAVRHLKSLVNFSKGNVVNIHYPVESSFLIFLLKRIGLFKGVVITSWHGRDVEKLCSVQQRHAMYFRSMKWADGAIACSRNLLDKYYSAFPLFDQKTRVVHNGFEFPAVLPFRKKLTASSINLLSIGTYEWKKGQDVLVRAIKTLVVDEKIDLKLVFVGRSGPALNDISELAVKLNVNDNIEFHVDVPHEDVFSYYLNADIFILPSRKEPFGIVILEAGAFCIPVVATNVGGIPEFISDGVNGVLVPSDDPLSLSNALKKLIFDDALRARLGKRLQEMVTDQYTWTNAYQKYVDFAMELIENR